MLFYRKKTIDNIDEKHKIHFKSLINSRSLISIAIFQYFRMDKTQFKINASELSY